MERAKLTIVSSYASSYSSTTSMVGYLRFVFIQLSWMPVVPFRDYLVLVLYIILLKWKFPSPLTQVSRGARLPCQKLCNPKSHWWHAAKSNYIQKKPAKLDCLEIRQTTGTLNWILNVLRLDLGLEIATFLMPASAIFLGRFRRVSSGFGAKPFDSRGAVVFALIFRRLVYRF